MIGGLFIGWVMGLFGFKGVVIAGMAQLFGVTITSLGYYFIFAMIGLFTDFIRLIRGRSTVEIKMNDKFNEVFKNAFEDVKNIKKK